MNVDTCIFIAAIFDLHYAVTPFPCCLSYLYLQGCRICQKIFLAFCMVQVPTAVGKLYNGILIVLNLQGK